MILRIGLHVPVSELANLPSPHETELDQGIIIQLSRSGLLVFLRVSEKVVTSSTVQTDFWCRIRCHSTRNTANAHRSLVNVGSCFSRLPVDKFRTHKSISGSTVAHRTCYVHVTVALRWAVSVYARVIAMIACPCVCLCVSVCVTRRYCIKTA